MLVLRGVNLRFEGARSTKRRQFSKYCSFWQPPIQNTQQKCRKENCFQKGEIGIYFTLKAGTKMESWKTAYFGWQNSFSFPNSKIFKKWEAKNHRFWAPHSRWFQRFAGLKWSPSILDKHHRTKNPDITLWVWGGGCSTLPFFAAREVEHWQKKDEQKPWGTFLFRGARGGSLWGVFLFFFWGERWEHTQK